MRCIRYLTFAAILLGTVWAERAEAAGVTKGPWIQKVGPTSAVIRVEVDPPAAVTLELGIGAAGTDAGGVRVLQSKEPRALHSIVVDKLEPATRYAFTVRSPAGEKFGALTTAPKEDSAAPFRFLLYGDNRTDDAAHAAVVRAMATAGADFLVNTGDFVSTGASPADWQTFFDIEAPLLRDRCLFSCVGNHELVDGAGLEYVRYFGPSDLPASATLTPDQLNGTFRWSNARFFLLNGMVSYKSGTSRAWLEKALGDSDNEPGLVWRIVVTHHAPWSSGPHGDNRYFEEAGIPQLLRAHKIDMVLGGHDHIYERGFADGTAYMISGGGGAPVYKIKSKGPYSRRSESVRHFVEASVSAVAIQFAATRPDGSIIERCGLRKGEGWDCDAPKAASSAGATSGGGAATPSSSDASPSASRSKCGCIAAGLPDPSAKGLAGASMLGLVLAAVRRIRRRAILGS